MRPYRRFFLADADPGAPQTVPVTRFQEVVVERDNLRGQLADQVKTMKAYEEKAATVDTLAKGLEAEKAARAADRRNWEMDLALSDAGISDPDGREVARVLYARQPEKDRPPLGDWLKSFKEKPETAPKALSVYLPQATAAAPAAADDKRRAPPTPGKGSTGQTPPASPSVSVEALKAARQKFSENPNEANKKALDDLVKAAREQRGR